MCLGVITQHGECINIPSIKGLTLDKARALVDDRNLDLMIMDSTFVLGKKPGMILEQDPKANTPVKPGRKIYVSVQVFCPPNIKMPNLIDASSRQAMLILKSCGLNMGKIIYKPDYANNAVLDMLFDGRSIAAGSKIRKGSYIDLLIANGVGSDEIPVPNLISLSLEEAKIILKENKLSFSGVMYDANITDTATAFIWKQSPSEYNEVGEVNKLHVGEQVDVWFTNDELKLDMAKPDSIMTPKQN